MVGAGVGGGEAEAGPAPAPGSSSTPLGLTHRCPHTRRLRGSGRVSSRLLKMSLMVGGRGRGKLSVRCWFKRNVGVSLGLGFGLGLAELGLGLGNLFDANVAFGVPWG